jgi:hypothetical protein
VVEAMHCEIFVNIERKKPVRYCEKNRNSINTNIFVPLILKIKSGIRFLSLQAIPEICKKMIKKFQHAALGCSICL